MRLTRRNLFRALLAAPAAAAAVPAIAEAVLEPTSAPTIAKKAIPARPQFPRYHVYRSHEAGTLCAVCEGAPIQEHAATIPMGECPGPAKVWLTGAQLERVFGRRPELGNTYRVPKQWTLNEYSLHTVIDQQLDLYAVTPPLPAYVLQALRVHLESLYLQPPTGPGYQNVDALAPDAKLPRWMFGLPE